MTHSGHGSHLNPRIGRYALLFPLFPPLPKAQSLDFAPFFCTLLIQPVDKVFGDPGRDTLAHGIKCKRQATLAQLVERLIRNQQVAGSIPAGGSM